MADSTVAHDDFHYEMATVNRSGVIRVHEYASEDPLRPGDIVRLSGRFWLLERIDPGEGGSARAMAKPARYRVRLRHSGRPEEIGVMRRYRPGAPRLGHVFVTVEDHRPVTWQINDEQLAWDDGGEPFVDLVAERDYAEVEEVPDHELEHRLRPLDEESLPEEAAATLARAEQEGLAVELAALEPGEEPVWNDAERFVDALILEEIEDDLLELCGADPEHTPRETWLPTLKERLLSDLGSFRADIEGPHDQIEEWRYRDGRVYASIGSLDDEADPYSGHGWMCRLTDASVLGAAGFERVRKVELTP
jgi:hypothetical protein